MWVGNVVLTCHLRLSLAVSTRLPVQQGDAERFGRQNRVRDRVHALGMWFYGTPGSMGMSTESRRSVE
jgi:hypothetical protein